MSRYPSALPFPADAVMGRNLGRLDADTAGALEARRAHLRELALSLAAERLPLEILLERLGGAAPDQRYRPDCLGENAHFVEAAFTGLSLVERIELCRMVCAEVGGVLTPAAFFADDEPVAADARGIIAYLQNAFTDRAYRAFSGTMRHRVRSQYHDSYGAACEAVSNGSCEACILPIEHAQDGKLLGFYRLIDRYELKIVCTCDIAQANGVESRFALLKKSFTFPLPDDALAYLFELSITRSTGHALGAVLDAAALCGLTVRRVDSIPLAYAEDSFAYHTVLAMSDAGQLTPFLLHLALDVPQYEPIGIYAHIQE